MRGLPTRRRRPGLHHRRAALALAAFMTATLAPAGPATATATSAKPRAAAAVATASRPVVATAADGSTTVFVRHPDGSVYRRVRPASTGEWGLWTDTLGMASGEPAVAHDLDGRLEVFVRGTDNHLWRQAQPQSGGWGPWVDLGTPPDTTVAGNPVVVADDNTASAPNPDGQGRVQGNTDGRLELFVRGDDGDLWHTVQLAPNGRTWSGWEQVGTTVVGDPAAVVTGDGRIALFFRNTDGHLRHKAQIQPGTEQTPLPAGNWSSPVDLGGGFTDNVGLGTTTIKSGTLLQVFGNHADGNLTTLAQSSPGTSTDPTGTWNLANEFVLGPALAGAPVVAANTDGRLAVFGVDPGTHLAIYRSQTNTARPKTNPAGIWDGVWAKLLQQPVGPVAVQTTSKGGFGAFAVGDGSTTLYEDDQLAAGTPASPRGVWLGWTDLAPIGSGPCDDAGTLDCADITNVDLGQALDLFDPSSPSTQVALAAPDTTDSGRQRWALRTAPDPTSGAFSLVNSNGECIAEQNDVGAWHLHLAGCAPGDTSQEWYLEPVSSSTDTTPASYRIRQISSGTCLSALGIYEGDAHLPYLPERIDCQTTDSTIHNTWELGRHGANAPGLLNLALTYAATQCGGQAPGRCTFVDATAPPAAYRASAGCVVGTVLYNQSGSTAEYEATVSHETGSEWSVGGSLTVEGELFEAEFDSSHTWVQTSAFEETAKVEVPPKMFGWVEHSPVVRETVGYWKITVNGSTWTVPGHALSQAADATDGVASVTVPRTSSTPPTAAQCQQ